MAHIYVYGTPGTHENKDWGCLLLTSTMYVAIQLAVQGSLLQKSNSLHITLHFEATLCIAVTYYFEIKVTSNMFYQILLLHNHAYIYQVKCKNETNLASMQNFSKIKVTITVLYTAKMK